ncbi:MAG: AraC family transcriptional regulator [Hyphomicrobiales bacterium]|nr:AraC family transcriptional regulator [Hyphomicrobiales bacterium]
MPTVVPMITAKALGAMPQFVLNELGEKALMRSMKETGLPYRFVDERDGYISEQSLASFIRLAGRQLGEEKIGLLWAPYLTVADYGVWGAYVLSAPSLAGALTRAVEVMHLHSAEDRAGFAIRGDRAIFAYRFGLGRHPGYADIAYSALAVIASIPKCYLGRHWRPTCILLDFPKPPRAFEVEDVFQCPVTYDSTSLALVLDRSDLNACLPLTRPRRTVTAGDVVRERSGGPPADVAEAVTHILHHQMLEAGISLEQTAKTLGLGVRSLQRRLSETGVSFRSLSNRARVQKSTELLRTGEHSITAIANELGYSSPNNFTRAFKAQVGLPPRAYAASATAG